MKIVVISLIFQNWNYLEDIQNNNRLRLLFCFCIYVCISFRVIYYIIYTRVCVFFFVFCVILFEQFGTLFFFMHEIVLKALLLVAIWPSSQHKMLLQYGSQMCLPQVYYFAISLIEKPSIGLAGLSLVCDRIIIRLHF